MNAPKHSFKTFREAAAFAKEQNGTVKSSRVGFDVILPKDRVAVQQKPQPKSSDIKSPPPTKTILSPGVSSGTLVANAKLCIDCGTVIPESRLTVSPNASRCIKCQSDFERTHDTRPHVNEGLAGTREENKKMRGQVWGEMRNRSKGH